MKCVICICGTTTPSQTNFWRHSACRTGGNTSRHRAGNDVSAAYSSDKRDKRGGIPLTTMANCERGAAATTVVWANDGRGRGGKGKGCGGANLAFFCGAIDDFYSLDSTSYLLGIPNPKSLNSQLCGASSSLLALWAPLYISPTHFRIYAFTFPRLPAMQPCLGARLSFGRNIHLPAASDGGPRTDPHCTRNLPLSCIS